MRSLNTESESPSGTAPGRLDPRALARFRAGDITALATLFRTYGARIQHLARTMLGNTADAEDATQEIFVRAFEHAGKFDARSELFTWLYRLAIHHCLNKIKQRSRRNGRERLLSAELQPDRPDSGPAALDLLIRDEQARRLDGLLQALPPHYRACLVLREIEGLSYARIAELLDVPAGTVMSRLARAREALRARLHTLERDSSPLGNSARADVVQSVEEQTRDDLC